MGSLRSMSKRDMSPARARLIEAVRAARYSLKELSQELGRNPSYLQQFVVKQSPRVLPGDVRVRLAELLGIPQDELRDTPALTGSVEQPARPFQERAPPANRAHTQALRVRLVEETDASPDGIGATPRTFQLIDTTADASLAIALTQSHGILQPRHVLLCDDQPARAGDIAFAIAPGETPAVGLLMPSAKGTVHILDGSDDRRFGVESAQVLRVIAIRTA